MNSLAEVKKRVAIDLSWNVFENEKQVVQLCYGCLLAGLLNYSLAFFSCSVAKYLRLLLLPWLMIKQEGAGIKICIDRE